MDDEQAKGGKVHSSPTSVLDDFGDDMPVTAAELDAVEAFLIAAINALFEDGATKHPAKTGTFRE